MKYAKVFMPEALGFRFATTYIHIFIYWMELTIKTNLYFFIIYFSGGLLCGICTKSIPRRPGKQGYECRDCHLICHKQCHVRAPQACPNPTVLSMEL